MSDTERYWQAYYDNEKDANKQMSFALLFSAGILAIIWICFLANLFDTTKETLLLINITFPIDILILVSPMFWIKSNKHSKPGFKYFVIGSFLLVMVVVNTILPKHGILGWAICIAITNHYYNPKVCKATFFTTLILMLLCIYAGMFVGEFDPDLLTGELDTNTGLIHNMLLSDAYSDVPSGRFQYLHALLGVGVNRYLTAFLFYYLARAALITILFFVSNGLNKRTYKLLVDEIKISNDQSKTKTELEVAKDIQLATLPVEFILNKDIEIQAELRAAKEVGGDFYDYFVLDDKHVGILIGDVSGKGIPAAMFMMKTITCFKNYMPLTSSPAETMQRVNDVIFEGNDSKMFVTCFLAVIDKETGHMKYANAGHNPPIVGRNGKYRYLKCNSGFVLGAIKPAYIVDEETDLEKGETITLYTDGITEARNKAGEFYGENRLLEFFNKKEYSCLVELHHELKEDVDIFVDGAEQSDDMTYITMKYHGDEYYFKEAQYPGVKEKMPDMLNTIETFIDNYHLDESFKNNLLIVGDELLSNIINYGYKDEKGDIFIRLLYNIDKKVFILTIIDQGEEFDPFLVERKPLSGDVNDIKPGGLGILIVKNLMTEYAYDRVNGKNIVVLKKKF